MRENPLMIPSEKSDQWLKNKGLSHRKNRVAMKTAVELGREAVEEMVAAGRETRADLDGGLILDIARRLYDTYVFHYYYGWVWELGQQDATAGNAKKTADEVARYAAEHGFDDQGQLVIERFYQRGIPQEYSWSYTCSARRKVD